MLFIFTLQATPAAVLNTFGNVRQRSVVVVNIRQCSATFGVPFRFLIVTVSPLYPMRFFCHKLAALLCRFCTPEHVTTVHVTRFHAMFVMRAPPCGKFEGRKIIPEHAKLRADWQKRNLSNENSPKSCNAFSLSRVGSTRVAPLFYLRTNLVSAGNWVALIQTVSAARGEILWLGLFCNVPSIDLSDGCFLVRVFCSVAASTSPCVVEASVLSRVAL